MLNAEKEFLVTWRIASENSETLDRTMVDFSQKKDCIRQIFDSYRYVLKEPKITIFNEKNEIDNLQTLTYDSVSFQYEIIHVTSFKKELNLGKKKKNNLLFHLNFLKFVL